MRASTPAMIDLIRELIERLAAKRIFMAVSWTMSSHILQQVIRLAANLLLTRLLAPEMFGVMAIIMAVLVILANLSDIGLRPSIIQSSRGDEPDFLNTAWTLQIIRGFVLWLITALIGLGLYAGARAGWVEPGTAWASPELPLALAVAGLSAALDGLISTRVYTAQRRLDFKRLAILELLAQLFSLATIVALTLVTVSVWPLVIGGVMASVAKMVLSHIWLEGCPNRLRWNRQDVREISHFGIWILLSSAATVLSANIDRVLLGSLFPAATLGLYSIALALATMVEVLGWKLFGDILLPVLSDAARQNHQEFRRQLYRLRLPLDALFLFASGGLFAAGQDVIHLLYDDRYHDAGVMLQILALTLIFARYGSANIAYIALGKPKQHAAIVYFKLIAAVVSILIGHMMFGLEGAIWAIACHGLLTLPLIFFFNWRNRIALWKLEVIVLPAWPAGFAAGTAVAWLM